MNATPLSFSSTFLKLCRCFVDGLKMCLWFGHDRQIIFLSLLSTCELCLWVLCESNSSYSLIVLQMFSLWSEDVQVVWTFVAISNLTCRLGLD